MSSSKNNPVASAILATYNSEKTIVPALQSLFCQTVPLELIVVDDGSLDHTEAVVKNLIPTSSTTLLYLKQAHAGPALARNLGAKHASTKLLLFVDADMTFAPDYVKTLIAPIQRGLSIGTASLDERVANWDNPLAQCWNLEEGWEAKKRFPPQKSPETPKFGTDYRAILKTEFDRVGGFDNVGYTDTWSLFQKLGVSPLFTQATCYHHNPATFASVYRQAKWAAKRPYKAGVFGLLFALLRTSPPVSLLVASQKSLRYHRALFFPFKLVYDWGRFVGILEMLLTGKLSK